MDCNYKSSPEFVGELWAMLPLAPGLVRPYSVKRPGGKMTTCAAWDQVEFERGLGVLRRLGWDVYIQLNASRPFAWRPSAADVPAIQAVVVDLDPRDSVTAREDAQKMWVHLATFGISPGQIAIVSSGRGVQLWILTDNAPREHATRVPPFLRELNGWGRSHMYSCDVDTSCSDLPRLARMPGTVNTKTGRTAELLFPARPGGWEWLARLPEAQVPAVPTSPRVHAHWVEYLPYLNRAGETFVTRGVARGNRHQQAYAAAASFRDAGAPFDVALAGVLTGAEICDPPVSAVDAERAVRSAYATRT